MPAAHLLYQGVPEVLLLLWPATLLLLWLPPLLLLWMSVLLLLHGEETRCGVLQPHAKLLSHEEVLHTHPAVLYHNQEVLLSQLWVAKAALLAPISGVHQE